MPPKRLRKGPPPPPPPNSQEQPSQPPQPPPQPPQLLPHRSKRKASKMAIDLSKVDLEYEQKESDLAKQRESIASELRQELVRIEKDHGTGLRMSNIAPNKTHNYTGFTLEQILELQNLLTPFLPTPQRGRQPTLSPNDQVFLVLHWLHHYEEEVYLANLYGWSQGKVSECISTCLPARLCSRCRQGIHWDPRHDESHFANQNVKN